MSDDDDRFPVDEPSSFRSKRMSTEEGLQLIRVLRSVTALEEALRILCAPQKPAEDDPTGL